MPNPQNIEKHKWKKGQTGNPNGRPKLLPELRELLAEVLTQVNEKNISLIEGMISRQAKIAVSGKDNDSTRAFDALMKYAYSPKTEVKQDIKQVIYWGENDSTDSSQAALETDGNIEPAVEI